MIVNIDLASHVFLTVTIAAATSPTGFYDESQLDVSTASILNTLTGISSTSCLLRCQRKKDCKYAAVRKLNETDSIKECLQLRNADPGGIIVTLLQEISAPENVSLVPGKFFSLLYWFHTRFILKNICKLNNLQFAMIDDIKHLLDETETNIQNCHAFELIVGDARWSSALPTEAW